MNVESVNAVIDDMTKEIARLEDKLAEREWIPCSERLPDTNYRPSKVPRVLVSWVDDNIGIYVSPVYCSTVESYYKNGQINAWMPLPKPYRGDEE